MEISDNMIIFNHQYYNDCQSFDCYERAETILNQRRVRTGATIQNQICLKDSRTGQDFNPLYEIRNIYHPLEEVNPEAVPPTAVTPSTTKTTKNDVKVNTKNSTKDVPKTANKVKPSSTKPKTSTKTSKNNRGPCLHLHQLASEQLK